MAKINGLELKNIKESMSHDGCDIYKADVYLDDEFIFQWNQDYMNGMDQFTMQKDYDLDKLWEKIRINNKDVTDRFNRREEIEKAPWEYTAARAGLACMLASLIDLTIWEEGFQRAQENNCNLGIALFPHDEYYFHIPKDVSESEARIQMLKFDINRFGYTATNYFLFQRPDDFDIYKPIKLSEISLMKDREEKVVKRKKSKIQDRER